MNLPDVEESFGAGLRCVACGYDVRGIPEAQCPECGFGYDHAAIRTTASHALQLRSEDLRKASRWAWVAIVFVLAALANRITSNPFERLIAFEPLLLIGCAGWCAFKKLRWPSGWESFWVIPGLLFSHGCVVMLVVAPHLCSWVALATCTVAWAHIVVRTEAASRIAGLSADSQELDILKRQERRSFALLIVGSFLTLIDWLVSP